jgi:hypothetical protein
MLGAELELDITHPELHAPFLDVGELGLQPHAQHMLRIESGEASTGFGNGQLNSATLGHENRGPQTVD